MLLTVPALTSAVTKQIIRAGPRSEVFMAAAAQLVSTLTCPACGHRAAETMPTDACRVFYECTSCNTPLRPKAGDCCVFCSYGDVPCPPIQMARGTDSKPACC